MKIKTISIATLTMGLLAASTMASAIAPSFNAPVKVPVTIVNRLSKPMTYSTAILDIPSLSRDKKSAGDWQLDIQSNPVQPGQTGVRMAVDDTGMPAQYNPGGVLPGYGAVIQILHTDGGTVGCSVNSPIPESAKSFTIVLKDDPNSQLPMCAIHAG